MRPNIPDMRERILRDFIPSNHGVADAPWLSFSVLLEREKTRIQTGNLGNGK